MKSYLTQNGLQLLQSALATLTDTPAISLTGMKVSNSTGFIPALDETQFTYQAGPIVIDKRNDPASVKSTLVHQHEMICTAIIDRDVEYANIGNVLFYANNIPFLWLVADLPFSKQKTNSITHFAGDRCYMSIVFRFPYIRKLISSTPQNGLHAKFPVFSTIKDLTVPAHTLADQAFVEQNTLFYGNNKPFFVCRQDNSWMAPPPIMNDVNKPYIIDSGTTLSGQ